MELTFLGTSCMVPTKDRNVSGIFLSHKDTGILVDCGEGTQRQMNIAGINRNRVDYILITHWHGDHVSGLIGLIQTLGNQNIQSEEQKKIYIYGPKETAERIEYLLKTCIFDNKLLMEIHEILPKKNELLRIIDKEEFYVEAALMDHGVPCLAYSFIEKDVRKIDMQKVSKAGIKDGPLIGRLQHGENLIINNKTILPDDVSDIRKGKKITFILDTGLCENAISLAKNSDILVCESSVTSHIEEKAEQNKHLTAKQAAIIANNANAKRLILTHISQRYKTSSEITEDAIDVFPDVLVAYDFMKMKI